MSRIGLIPSVVLFFAVALLSALFVFCVIRGMDLLLHHLTGLPLPPL